MSWIAVDTELPDHDKMSKLPSDSARWGWICVLAKAKKQRVPGTFADSQHFRHVMGRHGKFLPDYLKAGLIDYAPDDERDPDKPRLLRVHDWKRHQWAAAKAGQREDIGETSEGQKEDASRAVLVPVLVGSSSSTEGVQGEPDTFDAYWSLTTRYPKGGAASWLDTLTETYGSGPVIRAMVAQWTERTELATLLSRTEAVLLRDARILDSQAQAAERERLQAKRSEPRIVPDKAALDAEIRRLMEPGAAA